MLPSRCAVGRARSQQVRRPRFPIPGDHATPRPPDGRTHNGGSSAGSTQVPLRPQGLGLSRGSGLACAASPPHSSNAICRVQHAASPAGKPCFVARLGSAESIVCLFPGLSRTDSDWTHWSEAGASDGVATAGRSWQANCGRGRRSVQLSGCSWRRCWNALLS
jgi:hypothetical protein